MNLTKTSKNVYEYSTKFNNKVQKLNVIKGEWFYSNL